jgi:hypothetical protein
MRRRRAEAALRAARDAWRARALQVLLAATGGRPPPPWGGSLLDHVQVPPHAWTPEPWTLPGAHEVLLSWPPGRPFPARAFARQWNAVHGFPRHGPPWTWEPRLDQGVIAGSTFDVTGTDGRLHLPDLDVAAIPHRVIQGVCEDGTLLDWNLDVQPHALAGGATGSGKTRCILASVHHLLAARQLAAVVVLDWKRRDFRPLADRAFDPATCRGATVAMPDLDPAGLPTSLHTMAAAADAVLGELGRRMLAAEDLDEGEDPWADRLVLLVVDEALATLQREAAPDRQDKSPAAEQVRARNAARARIEYALQQVALLGRALRVHLLLGASSPRKEFLRGEAIAAVQHRVWFGVFLDVSERVVMFGDGQAPSPPAWPGYGIWRGMRADTDPGDPYLWAKGYWLPAARLRHEVLTQLRPADGWQPGSDPWWPAPVAA